MSMEKNGNTIAKGDTVIYAPGGTKTASAQRGEVLDVDPSQELVRVRWEQGQTDEWIQLNSLLPA